MKPRSRIPQAVASPATPKMATTSAISSSSSNNNNNNKTAMRTASKPSKPSVKSESVCKPAWVATSKIPRLSPSKIPVKTRGPVKSSSTLQLARPAGLAGANQQRLSRSSVALNEAKTPVRKSVKTAPATKLTRQGEPARVAKVSSAK